MTTATAEPVIDYTNINKKKIFFIGPKKISQTFGRRKNIKLPSM